MPPEKPTWILDALLDLAKAADKATCAELTRNIAKVLSAHETRQERLDELGHLLQTLPGPRT